MKTKTLVLLVSSLASCGGSGLNARDASVDGAAKPSDGLVPSPEVAVDRAWKSPDVPEPSYDVLVDEAGESLDVPERSYDAPVEIPPGTWDTQDPRDGWADAKDWDGSPGSGCRFRDTSGWAVITKVVYSSDPGHECQAVVTFDFITRLNTLDAGSAPLASDGGLTVDAGAHPTGGRMLIHPLENPPCSYLESNGIVVGATLPAIRQDEFAGACPTPVYVFSGVENSQYMGP